ncbi:hypothetical protein B0A48_15665 [Cryoendolithus antarcticus]|uniref:tripeptidyl-peptidase II n=1 Tax=Cryoendolithus antarcticus TaxID=1507870 RepID=A0A1V8SH88_9PEZI|nr:hypothetical protein B0A48_15665 [Cryoendolithus antarcticus]
MLGATLNGLALLLATAAAVPTPANHVLHEKRAESLSWVKVARVHEDVKLPMRIGLIQSNLDNAHDYLMKVSHPESEHYGKHYTVDEVTDLFAPAQSSVDAVRAWLKSAGIEMDSVSQSTNKQWLQFDASASKAEELLKTEYHEYEHVATGKTGIACDAYHLPAHVQSHVDYITPGVKHIGTHGSKAALEKRGGWDNGGKGHRKRPHPPPTRPMPPGPMPSAANLTACGTLVTPECIAAMYNITQGNKAAPGNELGIFEDLGDVYAQQDLDNFFTRYYPRIRNGTHPKLEGIDGGVAPIANVSQAGLESDLDFQISYPIIWPQNSILFQTDDPVYENNYTFVGFLNNFLDAIDGSYCSYSAFGETGNSPLDPSYPDPQPGGYKGQLQCGVYKPTNVISISYGGQESDAPVNYQRRQCNEYLKLGLQGISICVSSGDSGVAGPPGDDNPDGCLGPGGKIFSPDFPASCPYITTLGATTLPVGASAAADAEVAVTRFPSGGGFSNIYPIPSYQAAAVSTYLTKHTPSYPSYACSLNSSACYTNGGIYNRAGRGYPDFSAIGDNVVIGGQGRFLRIGGTSASSPAFAAILTRINEERIARRKSTIGFVNPALYAHPEVLHDITIGNNSGCGTPGFYAAPGWDPLTGLGTPNYPAMLKLFLSMP